MIIFQSVPPFDDRSLSFDHESDILVESIL